jgi:radical SAM protein with 4Fe4S-binding SPASM domain
MRFKPRTPDEVGLSDIPALVELHREAAERRQLMACPDLTYLFWECTLRCNLRCGHCGSSCEAASPVDELSTEQILGILDTIAEDFDASRIFVSITGGEPLLRRDLEQVAARMTELQMEPCIVTNGTLLTPERARGLYDAGMRTLSVSVDGPEAAHEALRGQGSFAKALAGVTAAAEAGFDQVEVITCVYADNLDQLAETELLARDAGANLWRLITIDCMGRQAGQKDPLLWLRPEQVQRLFDFIRHRRVELAQEQDPFDVSFSCGGFIGVQQEQTVRPGEGQCYAGLCVGSILCDGQVSACPSLPRDWAQGSALERRFSEIWETRFAAHRQTHWRQEGVCQDCHWFSICLGGGLHERLAQPDAFCWLDRQ